MAKMQQTLICIMLLNIFHITALPMYVFIDMPQKILVSNKYNIDADFVLKVGLVSHNENTEAITLRGCNVTDLDHDAVQNLYSLKYLDLSENNLTELKIGVFDGTPSLIYLNLSKNLFYEIPVNSFRNTPGLEVLDLRDNRLENFCLGTFDPLKHLTILDLSWNNFLGRDFHPLLFKYNINIIYISFSGNDMNDTPENLLETLELLETLNLNGCAIDVVPAFATKSNLKTLKELILSANQLSKLDDKMTFKNLENLEVLDLAENEIELVGENIFTPLKHLKVINLRNNKITYLPNNLFDSTSFLENIDVSHNNIATVSVDTFRCKPLKVLNLSFNKLTYLTENFCVHLKESCANLTEFYFHQNPWQCGCLKDLLDEVHDFHLLHVADVPGYKSPVCVTLDDPRCKRNELLNSDFIEIYYKIKSFSYF